MILFVIVVVADLVKNGDDHNDGDTFIGGASCSDFRSTTSPVHNFWGPNSVPTRGDVAVRNWYYL
jgi:hypothetical protein